MINDELKPLVLVVDDEPTNIRALASVLKHFCRVVVTMSGEEALEIAGAVPQPELIFLDVRMPEMDGFEVCRQLKGNPETCEIPVVFLTGLNHPEDHDLGIELGAADYLTKPASLESIKEKLTTHLHLAV